MLTIKQVSSIGLPAVALAALVYSNVAVGQDAPTWVPFAADFERVLPSTETVVTKGRIYRDSAGSERRESWTPGSERAAVIQISNQRTATFCQWKGGSAGDLAKGWTCQPMDVAPAPMRISSAPTGQTYEGLPVVERVFRARRVLFAPDLGYFPIFEEDAGVRMACSKIQKGEPARELFAPPAGSEIQRLQAKGGQVITARAGEAEGTQKQP